MLFRSDKVDTEIPSPVAGVITSIEVPADTTVAVGARLAVIGGGSTAVATPVQTPTPNPTPTPTPVVAPPVTPVVAAPVVSTPAPVAATSISQPADAYVTPIVRKLAAELGVNLASVKGTGVGGRIRKEDLQAAAKPLAQTSVVTAPAASAPKAAAPVAASPLRGTTVPMSRLRKVIAARMVESLQVSAQLTTVVEVDVTKIARLRDKAKAKIGRAHV